MPAAEKSQRLRLECLDADRQTIDPGRGKGREALGIDRVGVGFEGDFKIGRDRPNVARRPISAAAVSGSIRDGVPPPKKIVASTWSGARRAKRSSRPAAPAPARRVHRMGTWLLKSQ